MAKKEISTKKTDSKFDPFSCFVHCKEKRELFPNRLLKKLTFVQQSCEAVLD